MKVGALLQVIGQTEHFIKILKFDTSFSCIKSKLDDFIFFWQFNMIYCISATGSSTAGAKIY
jgi:hypothetical protein